jgi:DNA invertase Pin-like site-specific DNA recombinase
MSNDAGPSPIRDQRVNAVLSRLQSERRHPSGGPLGDPRASRDALIGFMAAMAQAQAEATKEAQRAGIAHAKVNNDGTKFRGRKPTYDWENFSLAVDLISQGVGVAEIARRTGLRRQTVYRIKNKPGQQAAALAAWYPISELPHV